ncbi:hypothetical protein Ae406Ps2_3877c [Pseudonocardia sp. Ae406_Ps2]|uniref:hypothetical protein n=1 Tax=unclassified Pseudonocardia TaxID=2619320 RepID=UPI00094B0084|nr:MULTISPECIES: hypothetical protein [unclassified Pseudonocardia]OLL98401.1 hypothetical protein Ae331Ps2_2068 [Pseudonocardia sp. Ae331_Ps2]OLM03873.1 hypothetical protein Ae406Ps2_3873c [Pseudonocardia sp. Ae406_Ps2]OLM03877.1 hypothetical protein Ae406Ps2_3877c [Pseudonocardia sp. Ae406_Ps2]OLM11278.1 hypothetical protein Ae505Ps2_1401 [Pseudonocardia sp. Ae505_Ps2]OLM25430.1 hypothetical protein Ae706Ps2_3863c [Pseudonocardia sp. Ae706_Ps2]
MEGTGGYLALVVVGVAITVGVGQILLRTGQPFLEDVFQSKETSHSINRLLVVLFHLLTLGVLGMISVIDIDSITGVQQIVFKIGVVLLVVGIAYGISMLVLLRIRERRRQQKVSADIDRSIAEQRRGVGRFRRDANTDSEGRTPAEQPED